MSDTPYDDHFVSWFRAVTPYINAFRGKTFVIAFGGKAVASEFAKTLAYDVNLLVSLGIRLVMVHGARPQIEEELREKNLESVYHRGYRVTDAQALDCVLDAVGSVYLEIEAMLSQGLPNTPMANSRIRVIGGNFITGQPIGVLDGIDMHYAGKVRKVDAEGINAQLGLGNIVLLNCEGPSPTGEIFNLQMEEAAEAVATAIRADKLVYLTDSIGVTDPSGALLDEMTADAVAEIMKSGEWLSSDIRRYLPCVVRASRAGVSRVHLVSFEHEKAETRNAGVLFFIMSHIGTGCLILGFLLLFQASGDYSFASLHDIGARMSPGRRDAAFILFAVIAVAGGIIAVGAKQLIHAVLGLVLSLFGVAGLYVYLGNQFIAAMQILIYVGAVAIRRIALR